MTKVQDIEEREGEIARLLEEQGKLVTEMSKDSRLLISHTLYYANLENDIYDHRCKIRKLKESL
ncbi:hypothetical protein PQC38_gp044 [Aeromonas phage BUCT695]|uniref:hypothetical protein n=1 Tax=Aeromonas phage BUCT695 TaxID=2908630 RepID=UPI00232978E1|nr:hypothetical protein PQC38_gp044 [Aeromonas phage BUCT695]UIW10520.1 hypothetical protein [Aeromonas phage BUCT695]